MRKFFVFIVGLFVVGAVFGAGENVPTSKSYVDSELAQKQDNIPANAGAAQVLTNTGVAGNVGTKNIYDSSAAYEPQADALVTAGTMNAAVQNAIEAEFKCISWVDDDPTKECLLLEILDTTTVQHPYVSATGTVVQKGTPTPEHPIEPVFYRQGDMVLRRVGDYADSYDANTHQITRRVGVKIFDGTESWRIFTYDHGDYSANPYFSLYISDTMVSTTLQPILCNILTPLNINKRTQKKIQNQYGGTGYLLQPSNGILTLNDWRAFLAARYAAGAPVTIYYPLATPVVEDWGATTYNQYIPSNN